MKLILFIILYIPLLSLAQQDSKVPELNLVDASPVYSINLDKTGPSLQKTYLALIPNVAQYITNYANATRFEKQMTSYIKSLNTGLNNNTGALVKIRLYADEFGNNYLPTNFLVPLAVGSDPIDAYSEFVNTPTLLPSEPQTTAIDASYFLWFYKDHDQVLVARISEHHNSYLVKQGNAVAMKKVQDHSYRYTNLSGTIPTYVARAQYWQGQMNTYREQLQRNNNLERIQSLVKKFDALQQEHTQLVKEYEAWKAKQENNNSLLNILETALSIGSFITDHMDKEQKVNYDPKLIERSNVIINERMTVINVQMKNKEQEIQTVEQEFKKVYDVM